MGLWSFLRPRAESSPYKPWDDHWYQSVSGVGSMVGIPVTPTVALQVAAVFACVKVISETLASWPLIVYERTGKTDRERAIGNPLYERFRTSPNAWQTAFEFIEDQTGHLALHGRCFAQILPGPDAAVGQLEPIHPDRVTVEQLANRRLRYQVRQSDGTKQPLTQDEVFHVRSRANDFYNGLSTLSQARDAIALARAIDTYASKFFANDASIGLVLEHPATLSDKAFEKLSEQFRTLFGGVGNAHKPKILENGSKLTRLPMSSAKEAQLTEAQENSVIQVCRFYRMPPHKVQHLLNATFSNIEHQGIEFVTDTMLPWARRWEARINATLITDPNLFAEFLVDGSLRGDNAARAAYYQSLFNIGAISQNEIRARENLNSIPEGDRYFVQGALVPTDKVDQFAGGQPHDSIPPAAALLPAPVVASEPSPPHRAFRVLVADAAERIARAETREIGKRIDKGAEDRSRFASWCSSFYGEHVGYVARTLQPLVNAWHAETGVVLDVTALTDHVIVGRYQPTDDFTAWSLARHDAITSALRPSFAAAPLPLAA